MAFFGKHSMDLSNFGLFMFLMGDFNMKPINILLENEKNSLKLGTIETKHKHKPLVYGNWVFIHKYAKS